MPALPRRPGHSLFWRGPISQSWLRRRSARLFKDVLNAAHRVHGHAIPSLIAGAAITVVVDNDAPLAGGDADLDPRASLSRRPHAGKRGQDDAPGTAELRAQLRCSMMDPDSCEYVAPSLKETVVSAGPARAGACIGPGLPIRSIDALLHEPAQNDVPVGRGPRNQICLIVPPLCLMLLVLACGAWASTTWPPHGETLGVVGAGQGSCRVSDAVEADQGQGAGEGGLDAGKRLADKLHAVLVPDAAMEVLKVERGVGRQGREANGEADSLGELLGGADAEPGPRCSGCGRYFISMAARGGHSRPWSRSCRGAHARPRA